VLEKLQKISGKRAWLTGYKLNQKEILVFMENIFLRITALEGKQ